MLYQLYLENCCQSEIGTIYLPFWALILYLLIYLFIFSLLKTEKLPSDNNINCINAINIPWEMSVTDANENAP